MQEQNYELPTGKKDKIALIRGLASGVVQPEDLLRGFSITLDLTGDGRPRELGSDEEELQRIKDLRTGRRMEVTLNI